MILKNKVVLVTGASKGIGYGVALEVARQGADVVLNYCTDRDSASRAAVPLLTAMQYSLPL